MRLDTIMVPLDGSALAESALGRAIDLARTGGGRLLLMRAVEAHALPGVDPTESQVRVVQDAEAYLADVRERLQRQVATEVPVEMSVWYGPAAYAIVEAARLRPVDLIVMTSHGRSGLGRLILGSVAESVLRGTTTPILLLRTPEAPVIAPAGPSVERRADPVGQHPGRMAS